MSSSITRCTLRADYYFTPSSCNPVNIGITKDMTPEEFDIACAKLHPNYPLNSSGRCGVFTLTIAASVGNVRLIEHIVGKDPTLQNIGTESGRTPLCCAVATNQRTAAKKLINLGSNVNMANTWGITPLVYAAEKEIRFKSEEELSKYGRETLHPHPIQKAQNVAMAKLLLIHGAVAEPAVNEEGAEVLQQAQKEINEMRASLFHEIYVNTDSIPLSLETVKTIAGYVPLDDIPETVPELPDPHYGEDPYRSEFPELSVAQNQQ